MDDYSAYADSAQARQMDRQARQNLDYWGNPVGTHESSFHTYDVAAAQARETEYRKGLAKRIGTAIAQMELICPPNPPETSATPQGARGIAMSQTTELAEVPPAETALQVFTTEKGLEPWLQQVRLKIDDFNKTLPELTTQKGRDRYASMAHQIAKSKTALEAVGKALSAKQKELPKKIDAERKRVWDTLEVWQKEVRRPLDDWQAAEDARIDGHKDSIQWLVNLAEGLGDLSAEQISQRVNDAEAFTIGQHLEEFEADAARAKDASLGKLRTSLDARRKHEVELAEIARFNVEKEERDRAEHEARIAREAAEKAQREANEQAEADRKAAAEREQQLINQAERQRL
jgi:colicin import membrane protein